MPLLLTLLFAIAVLTPSPPLSPEALVNEPSYSPSSVVVTVGWETHEEGWIPPALRPKPKPVVKRSIPSAPSSNTGMGSNVAQWEGLVTAYFGDEAWRALCLMGHESGGNPGARNRSSGAAGLLQLMPFWADHYGVSYESLFDPETNIRIAKGIRDQQGWGAWSPYNRGLCH